MMRTIVCIIGGLFAAGALALASLRCFPAAGMLALWAVVLLIGLLIERWRYKPLAGRPPGPVIAATDYVRAFADQIRAFVPRRYLVLGTDGYGRSDYRRNLRRFFEVDRHYVAVAALSSLAEEGVVPADTVADAISRYGIDPGKPDPSRA